MIQNNGGQIYIGVVEDRNDPLHIGRVRARVVGLHIHDKTVLPTDDLPWAMLMQPATNGTGSSPVGPAEGTSVVIMFNDWPENQQPIVIGILGGIPQGDPVNIDKFEDTPIFKDTITPQGRKVPVTAAEATGNQTGPLKGDPAPGASTTSTAGSAASQRSGNSISSAAAAAKTGIGSTLTATGGLQSAPTNADTPVLVDNLVSQSQTQTTTTAYGVVQNILTPTAKAMGSVGGLLNAIGGVGSTYSTAKNAFENLVLGTGNINSAVGRFKTMASQSGPLGSAISTVLNGNASLKGVAQGLGFSVSNIQSSFNSIKNVSVKNPRDLLGVIQNAESIANQIGSAATSAQGTIGAIIGEVSQVTVGGTIGQIGSDAANMVGGITGELGGIVSAGVGQVQSAANILGLGNITGGVQTGINNIAGSITGAVKDLFGSSSPLAKPDQVAGVLNGEYSTKDAVAQNVGNISVMSTTPPAEVDSKTFEGVAEGATPPINGSYGGPNFGGASPVLEKPKQDMTKYEGGSTSQLQTSPPPSWKGDRAKAEKGIKALIDACMKYGLSTNEQKAALLGIAGGECGWIPQEESCQYSDPSRLCQIFQTTFKGKTELAEKYANWVKGKKGTTSDFFNFVYDPANNGRQLGNSQPGDGGKFYGRGFIQLTGRANYERYALLSGHPIDKNPDLLNTDYKISAEIAVLYLMDRVKGAVPTAHPGYFYAAKKSVGNNSPDIAARKLAYYEHFYGTNAPETYGYTDKQAGSTTSPNSYDGAMAPATPPDNQGFKDPHGKYPFKRRVNEPETNRLARGNINETIVALKESKREMGIPTALGGPHWNQPSTPYGAKYPYNRVTETESGHVQEFDDTPGMERIHTYHRSGTFTEIDATGTQVTKIVGDGYTIYDRNGFISIHGDANVTVAGNVNIFCRSDANIEVAGSAEMKIGGNFDIGVARDMNVAVEGNFSLWANGAMNLQAKGKGHILTNDNLYVASSAEMHVQSTKDMFVQSKMNANVKTTNSLYVQSTEATHIKAGTSVFTEAAENVNVKAGADAFVQSGGNTNIQAGGDVAVDGANVHLNSGVSAAATEATDSTDSVKALVHGMVPPALGVPLYPNVEPLVTPQLLSADRAMYELNGHTTNPTIETHNKERIAQEGKTGTYESEKAAGSGGSGGSVAPSPKQAEILACGEFTANYKLSEHFTLGMLFDGGFNVKHKLIDQNGLTKAQIVANLASLCENILEKYLKVLPGGINGYRKQWTITSGYRMGTGHSDHGFGRACDIALIGRKGPEHMELIKELDKLVSYDQLILESLGPGVYWIHTGFRGDGKTTFGGGTNRADRWTMNNHKNHTPYPRGGWTLLA